MGTAFLRQLQQEFKGYNGQKLAKDLMAGLTVAAVALPLALAFGVSAGATAACGLVTAIVAGLIISALTGGYYQISGPTGAMAAILGSLIATYGMQGMFVATFLAGALLILAAVLHLGNLTAFVPAPVITGFTSGIAVIIAMGQIDNFFGTHSEGASAIAKIISYKDPAFIGYCYHADRAFCRSADGVLPEKVERGRTGLAHRHYHRNCGNDDSEARYRNRRRDSENAHAAGSSVSGTD